MATRRLHRCSECGHATPRWEGRCGGCGAWNTLVEEAVAETPAALAPAERPVPIGQVPASGAAARATGIPELDRVLGGGLVPGSVTLLGGEPGIGKSTLLLQALAAMAEAGTRCLLVSAEESCQQVRLRAERLDALRPELWLASDTALPHVLAHAAELVPDVLAVDSIQTVHDPALGSSAGSVAQVRECAAQLVQLAKTRSPAVILVGHVTKEGTLAGPRVLEHVVDTVLSFEGERHHALRLLRAQKHRFGSTDELGLFEMSDAGLLAVADPSCLFLGDRRPGVAGCAVVPVLDGRRPLLVEVQALLVHSNLTMPRRSVQGLDPARLALVLAVLERRCDVSLARSDVYASAAGGVRVGDPGADLGVALALVSASTGCPLADDVIACGEIGLGGEVRQVAQTGRRLAEAARVGFRVAIVPGSAPDTGAGIELVRVATVRQALDAAGLPAGRPAVVSLAK